MPISIVLGVVSCTSWRNKSQNAENYALRGFKPQGHLS